MTFSEPNKNDQEPNIGHTCNQSIPKQMKALTLDLFGFQRHFLELKNNNIFGVGMEEAFAMTARDILVTKFPTFKYLKEKY